MNRNIGLRNILLFVLFLPILNACGGLPDESKKQGEAVPEQIKTVRAEIEKKKNAFFTFKNDGEYISFFKFYDDRELWNTHFLVAFKEVDKAESIFNNQISDILKRNEKDDAMLLATNIKRVNGFLRLAKVTAGKPNDRMQLLRNAKDHGQEWLRNSQVELAQMRELVNSLSDAVEKTKTDHPLKKGDLTEKFFSVKKFFDDASKAVNVVQQQLSLSDPDYALVGDNVNLVSNYLKLVTEQDTETRKKLEELYRSYSKTIIDMRTRYYVVVGRTSWDNDSDWDSEDEYVYSQREVSMEDYEILDQFGERDLATHSQGIFGGDSISINHATWNNLGINLEEGWSSSDDEAVYYVSDMPTINEHKYSIEENGSVTETDWVVVDEAFYYTYDNNMGMNIVSKPYGMYESEVVTVASPAGMSYIAPPQIVNGQPVGSNHYGYWRSGAGGNYFWEFHGQYRFTHDLIGVNYSYYDYLDYEKRDRSKPYYGRNNQYGTSGTFVGSSPRYQRSSFARSGGFKRQGGSVRGAGSASRGRGPGRGGK